MSVKTESALSIRGKLNLKTVYGKFLDSTSMLPDDEIIIMVSSLSVTVCICYMPFHRCTVRRLTLLRVTVPDSGSRERDCRT